MTPCDAEGERWLKKTWIDHGSSRDTELQAVPIQLSEEVIKQLKYVCIEKRVPRDAFLDCALRFFSARLYEAAIVIKTPRTKRDLGSQVIFVLNQPGDELEDSERQRAASEVVQEWFDCRDTEPFQDDFYEMHLSFNSTRVSEERALLESLGLSSIHDPDEALVLLEKSDSSIVGPT